MIRIINTDVLKGLTQLEDQSVQCVITSPPYWGLRDYGIEGQIGLEKTPDLYVEKIVQVFREVERVLRDDGTLWLNLGDSYVADSYVREKGSQAFQRGDETRIEGWLAKDRKYSGRSRKNLSWASGCGLKKKDLCGIPWRVAFALQNDGWYLRSDIIWSKPNPMPESVTDRPTKSHEYVFLLTKKARYYYTHGSNRRTVWEITTKPFKGAHFAVFPEGLVEPCIKAGSKNGDVVLDPFGGSGTVAKVASDLGRSCILIEINPAYVEIMKKRLGLLTWLQEP